MQLVSENPNFFGPDNGDVRFWILRFVLAGIESFSSWGIPFTLRRRVKDQHYILFSSYRARSIGELQALLSLKNWCSSVESLFNQFVYCHVDNAPAGPGQGGGGGTTPGRRGGAGPGWRTGAAAGRWGARDQRERERVRETRERACMWLRTLIPI